MLLYVAVSTALFALAIAFVKVSAHTITSTFGAIAFAHLLLRGGRELGARHVAGPRGRRRPRRRLAPPHLAQGEAVPRPGRAPVVAVAAGGAASRSIASNRALKSGAPEVHFVPEDKTVVAKPGLSLLEIAESNGMTIESGCRMGICGADPVAIKDGMECLSGISDDEKATLERLGLAPNTRMACCARVEGPVSVSLKPDKAQAPSLSKVQGFAYDKSVANVVVLGNGIAGVTAVDHIRRRHPLTQIDLVAEEPHHLYNRMGIARLVYGKSAMQGLYLNPDAWYGERDIETWLNTRALQIDRAQREIHLGTGEKLPYDRLILAMGSRAFVPPIEGFGIAGSGVLRKADDAIRVRNFAQRHRTKKAAIAGGGLLGLEAAYALHQLGMRATVLERSDRLLKRQLDARAAHLLQKYLEGLGLEIVTGAETQGRVRPGPAGLARAGRRPPAGHGDPARRGGHPAQRRARPAGGAGHQPRRARQRPHADGGPAHPRGRRRRRVRGPGPRTVADRGRPGRGGGRRRRRRQQAL